MSWSGGRSPRLTPGALRSPSTRRLPLSSSELSPFSFSEDTIKILASDIERQNCLIPLNLPVNPPMTSKFQSSSQPQTPVITPLVDRRNPPLSSSIDIRNPMSFSTEISFRSSDPPTDRDRTLLGHSRSVGGGSLATPGRTMRDYDESFKEMKKENFNLKLRIFFLEERMGISKSSTKEESATQNIDLKVQLESSKQDLTEKAALLIEASQAVEDMEHRMKDQELKFREQINNLEQRLLDFPESEFNLGHVPMGNCSPRKPLRSPGLNRRSNIIFPSDRDDITNNNNKLSVLKEQDEIIDTKKCDFEHEEKIRELELVVEATEAKLQQVKTSLEMNKMELETFTSQLVKREQEIETLKIESNKKDKETTNLLATLEKQTNAFVSQELDLGKCGATNQCLCGEDSQKIKDQLKLQIQERKLLLKKINMLKEQLTLLPSVDQNKELESVHQLPELGIQCDLGHGPAIVEAYSSSVSRYRQMIVNLNKKLATSTEFCQTLQEQMEEIVDTAEHAIEEGNIDIMKDVLVKSRSVSRNLSHDRHISFDTSEEEEESIKNSFDKKFDNPLSEASTWNMELPSFAGCRLI